MPNKQNKEQMSAVSEEEKIEAVAQEKIEAVEKVPDMGERLMQYITLRDSFRGVYTRPAMVDTAEGAVPAFRLEKVRRIGDGAKIGQWPGLALGTVGILAIYSATGPVGLGLAVGCLIGGIIHGAIIGGIVGAFFKKPKPLTPAQVHIEKMMGLEQKMDSSISSLATSLSENPKAVEASPRAEEVRKILPNIAETFNQQTKVIQNQKKFLASASSPAVRSLAP